ncbi:hypothetical protein K461DRAFT_35196 [Myriangium duriaei CBS 260.36]|uniref:Velvet domain-containing protein n=1 Tax=Myriangium duriaei CBS 260.36 TaxID=1168546 RepID=A0A9P4MJJ8_9PEZI|nr:hypothetical protein K461DRAFT_35196 [Myriangium duriaei CBS 260.36]
MSMQTATHSSLPPPYAHPAYPNTMDEKQPMSTGHQQGMQVHGMVPAPTQQAASNSQTSSGTRGNYEFSLDIVQQPVRARMCGFGDKDRRPITPPPCVRLVVTDLTTGREVPADEIDPAFFLLTVDLWDENATSEKNIVRSSSNSPAVSISTATTTSFPVPPERVYTAAPTGVSMYPGAYGVPGAAPGYGPTPVYSQGQPHPSMYPNAPAGYYPPAPGYPQQYPAQGPPGSPAYAQQAYGQTPVGFTPSQAASGMFTRNLIGSLTVNAFPLTDLDGKKGHWFILQDLSVRTEGMFRLKFSFVDVGTHQSPKSSEENKLHCGKTNLLATAFSSTFQVFSAKKFPGVIESTPLSKSFAGQGIKIPIRKDGVKEKEEDADE